MHLSSADIQTGIHYPIALPMLSAYAYLRNKDDFLANKIAAELLSLPIGEHLSNNDVKKITISIEDFFA